MIFERQWTSQVKNNTPRNETDAIVFELAKQFNCSCKIHGLPDNITNPCGEIPMINNKYIWYYKDTYFQVEVTNGEILIGSSTAWAEKYQLCDPTIIERMKHFINAVARVQDIHTRMGQKQLRL